MPPTRIDIERKVSGTARYNGPDTDRETPVDIVKAKGKVELIELFV